MSRPLRIALVQTQAENAGAQQISRLVAGGLEARGHDVRQIFFYRRTASFDDVSNARLICRERPTTPWAVMRFLLRLRAELRGMDPDVVVAFQHYGNAIAAPVARSVGCRAVVANQVSAGAMVNPVLRWADAALGTLGFYSRIVVNSIETEAMYRGYPRPYARRLVHIDHGFSDKTADLSRAEARAALGLPADVTLLGCASRLHPLKQLDCAIRVLAIRPHEHLALAGGGAERQRLCDLATALGVRDRLHMLGELDPARVGVFLATLDVFLHPSAAETFGLAAVEAAQAGVPVVVNALDVLRDVLAVDGEPCALFADAQDPQALSAAIESVLTGPGVADRLRQNGRRLSERYPIHEMVDGYARLIDELVGDLPCASPSRSTLLPSGAGTR